MGERDGCEAMGTRERADGRKTQAEVGTEPSTPKGLVLCVLVFRAASSLASPLNAAHLAGILASRSDTELALRQALQEDKQEVPEALAGRRKLPKSRENLCNRD